MSARSTSTMSASTARPPTTAATPTSACREVFFTTRHIAQVMDDLGYYALWTAEHHFQHEGYECLPNLVQLGLWLATQTKRLKFGCALQRAADVASDPAGRGLRDGRHRHRRPRHHGRRPRLPHARGGNLRRAADRCREATARYFEEQLQLMLACFNQEAFHFKGKYFTCPPPGGLSRLPAQGHHHGAAAEAPAGGGLDAGRLRQDHRHDGAIWPQGDGHAERREDPRRRGARLSGRLRPARPAEAARART